MRKKSSVLNKILIPEFKMIGISHNYTMERKSDILFCVNQIRW